MYTINDQSSFTDRNVAALQPLIFTNNWNTITPKIDEQDGALKTTTNSYLLSMIIQRWSDFPKGFLKLSSNPLFKALKLYSILPFYNSTCISPVCIHIFSFKLSNMNNQMKNNEQQCHSTHEIQVARFNALWSYIYVSLAK